MKDILDGGVHCLGTWMTLPVELPKLSDFLANKLHTPPQEGGFVTLNRWMTLLGPKFGSFETCITKSPRSDQLDGVCDDLLGLWKKNKNPYDRRSRMGPPTSDRIRPILERIAGDDYSHYVPPAREEWHSRQCPSWKGE